MVGTKQVAMRWPIDLLHRLDECAEKFRRQTPGSGTTRSDVVRILLERGLATEGFAPPEPATKKAKR
jgi:hypothetical protein